MSFIINDGILVKIGNLDLSVPKIKLQLYRQHAMRIDMKGLKSWKHDFEIIGDPKGPPIWSTFWSSFEAPNP